VEWGIPFVQIALAGPAVQPLLPSAALVGPLGIALIVVLVNVGLWGLLRKAVLRTSGGAVGAVACFVPLGLSLLASVPFGRDEHVSEVSVAAVPGFVSLGPESRPVLSTQSSPLDATDAGPCSLYVWGERALRAVQTGRSILQVAIGGTTAVIDQRGRILDTQTTPESLKSILRTRIAPSNQPCAVACREPAIVDASVFLALAAASLGWPLLLAVRFVRPERTGGARVDGTRRGENRTHRISIPG